LGVRQISPFLGMSSNLIENNTLLKICGVYHGFMPIAIESVSVQDYLAWVDAQ